MIKNGFEDRINQGDLPDSRRRWAGAAVGDGRLKVCKRRNAQIGSRQVRRRSLHVLVFSQVAHCRQKEGYRDPQSGQRTDATHRSKGESRGIESGGENWAVDPGATLRKPDRIVREYNEDGASKPAGAARWQSGGTQPCGIQGSDGGCGAGMSGGDGPQW